jgi:YidC/Oxa1 family membrane protein insertase
MDRTSIIAIIICLIVLVLWFPLVNRIFPPKPLPPGATNAITSTLTVTNQTSTVAPGSAAQSPFTNAPKLIVATNIPEQTLVITNQNARYTFSSHGGGLKLAELVHYPETVSSRRQKQPAGTNRLATLNAFTPAPTMALLDGEAVQGDGVFELSEITNGVRAVKTLTNGLVIIKDFQLTTNYLISVTVRLENHSDASLTLPAQEWIVGTATPLDPRDNGQLVGVLWYNGSKSEEISAGWFAGSTLGCSCLPGTPRAEFRGGATNVVWVAAHNQFFTLIAMPQQPGQEVVIRKIGLPRPTGEDARMVATNAPAPLGYEAAVVYPSLTLAPTQALERQVMIFAGPKEYRTLARIANTFNNNVDLAMGFDRALFGRFTAFFARLMLLSMNALHDLFRVGYGWVIIILTVLIKALFWPLTQASTRSMKRMQAMQPQMNALREKYKDDPLKANRKMMEFMKEHKISPLGGCLPMLLQMPVFIGLYVMIQSAIELRGAQFLWAHDLTQPDTLFIIPALGFLPFFGIPGVGLPFNLLPLIMGVTMLWQSHLTPPSPGMDPMQQKIMRYMPLMFMLFLYNFSAGLTLYWTVQNLLTILQTKLTRTAPPAATTPVPAKAPVLTPQRKKRK